MAQVDSIDSRVVGLRYALETTPGVLPGTPDWVPMEPNTMSDWGGAKTLKARNFINKSRQRKKGVIIDNDVAGTLNTDMTQSGLQEIMQGFFFAAARVKDDFGGDGEITNVDGTADEFDGTGIETGIALNDLVFSSGFSDSANNGVHLVDNVTGPDTLGVTTDLVDEAAPPNAAKVVKVGVQAAAGDIDVDAAGSLPTLTSTTLDFTTLGFTEGEWIYIGGDLAAEAFVNAENNGFKRIRSIAANVLTLDKSDSTMVTESSTTETIRIFLARVIRNEQDTLIVKQTYQFERELGAPDDASPNDIQGEYNVGCVAGEATFNIPTADFLTVDMVFMGQTDERVTGPTGLKTGNRPTIPDADAFNTSSDFSRLRLARVVAGDEAPTPFATYVQELTVSVNNNLTPNKAVSVLGAFSVTGGTFQVSAEITAVFNNIDAQNAVADNDDVTIDFAIAKNNSGVVMDIPLASLGDGRANVELDTLVTLPLTMEAAEATKVDSNLDYTLMMCFFDYLPTAASA